MEGLGVPMADKVIESVEFHGIATLTDGTALLGVPLAGVWEVWQLEDEKAVLLGSRSRRWAAVEIYYEHAQVPIAPSDYGSD